MNQKHPNVARLLTQTPSIIQELDWENVNRRLGWSDGLSVS